MVWVKKYKQLKLLDKLAVLGFIVPLIGYAGYRVYMVTGEKLDYTVVSWPSDKPKPDNQEIAHVEPPKDTSDDVPATPAPTTQNYEPQASHQAPIHTASSEPVSHTPAPSVQPNSANPSEPEDHEDVEENEEVPEEESERPLLERPIPDNQESDPDNI